MKSAKDTWLLCYAEGPKMLGEITPLELKLFTGIYCTDDGLAAN